MSKFRYVSGKILSQEEVRDWSSEKLLSFLHFMDFWLQGNDESVNINLAKREEMKGIVKDHEGFEEFMMRIKADDAVESEFKNRLFKFSRIPLAWLKKNPHARTPEMEEILRKYPKRLGWALHAIEEVTTDIGVVIPMLNNKETLDPSVSNKAPNVTDVKTPQAMYQTAVYNLAALIQDVAKSIKRKDLRKLDIKDKFYLLTKGLSVLESAFQKNPKTVVFKQININSAKKEKLEKAVLDYHEAS